jgi:hypothetical protein
MPNLSTQPVAGGPTQPVFIMNGQPGDSGSNPLGGVPANLSTVSGTKAVAGNNTLLPAPGAGLRISVFTIYLQNESATATTVQLVDQVARFRALLDQYRYFIAENWKLNANTALTLNLSGANSIGYSIQYSIDAV